MLTRGAADIKSGANSLCDKMQGVFPSHISYSPYLSLYCSIAFILFIFSSMKTLAELKNSKYPKEDPNLAPKRLTDPDESLLKCNIKKLFT